MLDKFPDREPIAIIGIGCRFPGGGETPKQFWEMLLAGKDAIKPIPTERWDADAYYHPDFRTNGKIQVKEGGFVENIDMFDAQFFGIAPVEANRMDPQQRLLLEHTYYAFEDAGLTLEKLAGSRTSVFIGLSSTDYAGIQNSYTDRANIGAYTNTGGAASIASNRISYVFDLNGPSFTVDTACSSGLVAAHLACRSIWSGESDMAIVGGVNLILRPEVHIGFSNGGFLSPDGRCKVFDADADGYVRSEGVGIIILQPLNKALIDNISVYATIIGSAINEDGRTGGISMPSMEAQVDVLKKAYLDAGISPQTIDYVEAHGTGTAIGDPVECNSIASVLCGKRRRALPVGSVKSNIGHLEPASGLAGLIKTALSLKEKIVPGNIHFKHPNPKIDFDKLGIVVPTGPEPLNKKKKILTAGVNSFGFGGANAHIVLQSHPGNRNTSGKMRKKDAYPLFLSARSETALISLAKSYKEYIQDIQPDPGALCYAAATKRSTLDIRLAIPCTGIPSTVKLLDDFINKVENPLINQGRTSDAIDGKTAFIYSGQGPQWYAMGRELLKSNRILYQTVKDIDKILTRLGWLKKENSSLLQELRKDKRSSRMNETEIAQPAIFALQVGLTNVWNSLGVFAEGIAGHSIGEVAASWAAGAIDLEEATRIVYWRSRCQASAAGKGKMLAAAIGSEQANEIVSEFKHQIDIAAVNAPAMFTLAGETDALKHVSERLTEQGIFNRFLIVDVPFHSHFLDSVIKSFKKSLGTVRAEKGNKELYSTVLSKKVKGTRLTTSYWAKNIRQSVLFFPTVEKMVRDGYNTFIEISPHPILAHGLNDALDHAGKKGIVVDSLKRKEAETPNLLSSLGALYCQGYPRICLDTLFDDTYQPLKLPHYPWQREHYWMESTASSILRKGIRVHPHLIERIWSPDESGTVTWKLELDPRTHPYILDHRVQGPLVYPGAGHVDLVLGVAIRSFGEDFGHLEELEFIDPLFLPDEGEPLPIQISVKSDEGSFVIASGKKETPGDWTIHSRGKINHIGDSFTRCPVNLKSLRKRITEPVDLESLFNILEKGGLLLGPTFKGLTRLMHTENEALGEIRIPENLQHDFRQYNIHPSLLDASFQTAFGIIEGSEYSGVYIPVNIKRIKFYRCPESGFFSYAKASTYSDDIISADIWVLDKNGEPLLEIQGFTAKYLKGSRGEIQGSLDSFFYSFNWHQKDRTDLLDRRTASGYIASPRLLKNPINKLIRAIGKEPISKDFATSLCPIMNDLSMSYIVDALVELGFLFRKGITFSSEKLMEELAIIPTHRHLFNRLLEHLVSKNILRYKENNNFSVISSPKTGTSATGIRKAKKQLPQFSHELSLLELCGPELANVLHGEKDPLELLFSQNSRHIISNYYSDAYTFTKYYRIISESIHNLISGLPDHQTLRVLEIGAGTGGTTHMILPILPEDRTEYFFTDISPEFLSHAKARFEDYSFIKYGTFDLTKDISEQDLIPNSYDLIIASNVIHGTPDILKSLKAVKSLLADGGAFFMLEVTNTTIYPDLIFGLTEGWWNYLEDPWQRGSCSLSADEWLHVLEHAGFKDSISFSDIPNTARDIVSQTMFATRAFTDSRPPMKHSSEAKGFWFIFPDKQGVATKIAEKLNKQGHKTEFMRASGIPELSDYLPNDDFIFKGVIYCAAIDSPALSELHADRELINCLKTYCFRVIEIANNLEEHPLAASLDLWCITTETANIDASKIPNIQQTPLIGTLRVIANEIRSFKTHQIDVSTKISKVEINQLIGEITAPESEPYEEEIAFRWKKRFVRRIERSTSLRKKQSSTLKVHASGSAYHLQLDNKGVIEETQLIETNIPEPEADEVIIDVRYAPLNFRDIMLATGTLPANALEHGFFGKHFGLECAGTVAKVGKSIKKFKPGDRVIAIARDCIAGKVRAKADFTVKVPVNASFADYSVMPMAYLTAYYSLIKMASLQPDERVLIHAATGGVGIAAINIATHIGAEIFVTASTEKHPFLRQIGINHIYDSRSPSFYDEIMKETGGKGINVILNSLSGPLLTQSLKILAPCGRFIEIGKNDLYAHKRIDLNLLSNNRSYSVVDIDRLLIQKPLVMKQCLEELFTSGKSSASEFKIRRIDIQKHPCTIIPVNDYKTALRKMTQAKHIGKIILSMQGDIFVKPRKTLTLDSEATYLVVGGTGGFGLSVGKFLASRGAGHVVLASRTGKLRTEDMHILEEIKKFGTEVTLCKVDISKRNNVKKLIDRIDSGRFPLKGIFQSAMVLDDGLLKEMNWTKYSIPLKAKINGTWNLHLATEKLKLDYFVCFSSIASLYGTPGQANYAAANCFLDNFAYFRRAKGLPATTVNWGVIGDVGFVSRDKETRDFLANHGWSSVPLPDVLTALEKIMLRNDTQVGFFNVDWKTFAQTFPHNLKSGRIAHLHKDPEHNTSIDDNQSLLIDRLRATIPQSRASLINNTLREMVADILGMNKEKIDIHTAITRMGLDSLMANQIRSWLTNQTGISFSLMQIMQGPTVSDLSAIILKTVFPEIEPSADTEKAKISPWFLCPQRIDNPAYRLFCFPYLGAGGAVYNGWQYQLENNIEFLTVQFPGREERIGETPLSDSRLLFKQLAEQILPLLDVPYFFYGHSFGGNMAANFASYLHKLHGTCPEHLFIGAAIPPDIANPLENIFKEIDKEHQHNTPTDDASLIRLLRELGVSGQILEDNRNLKKIFPALRGDLAMSRQHLILKEQVLACPITAIAGLQDTLYTPQMISRWKGYSKDFTLIKISGSHLFIHEKQSLKELFRIINSRLK